jgi:putative nucleotidyltransferase with HDIG domain
MPRSPSRPVLGLATAGLIAAVAVAVGAADGGDWDLLVLLVLLAFAVVSDLSAVEIPTQRFKLSGSFLSIVLAAAFLGGTPAALVGVLTILIGWTKTRYDLGYVLVNVAIYAWFPLAGGIAFSETVSATGAGETGTLFYLLVFGLFVASLAMNFSLIAGIACYEEGSSFATKVRRALLPILPSELASALAAVAMAYVYVNLGLAALVLLGAVMAVFQWLVGALLLSQQRGDELELRARQLAGFQIALLTALLKTLDLRDQMTARHSAAVARYAKELSAGLGLSTDEQEIAHTAGLLHDIGKFSFPDRLLKRNVTLTEDDWQLIRMHPYQGARIVAQVDGFQPIADVILAHHERIDGLGYPRGLHGEEIPLIARIIAVVDTYDVITARDTYRNPISSFEAIEELRRVAGTQLDGEVVEAFVSVLADKDLAYRHGEDASFDAELALEKRMRDSLEAGSELEALAPEETGLHLTPS